MPTQLLTATGTALIFAPPPTIISRRVQSLTASGAALSSGSVTATTKLPSGGLTDFGLWAIGQPDSAMTRDMSHHSGADTSAALGWLTASAPATYAPGGTALWNRAAYAGVGVKWTSLANAERHSFDNVQMEHVPSGNRLSWDATSWEGRRCYIGTAGLTHSSVTASSDTALSGSRSGKITYSGATAGTWGYWINPTAPLGMAPCTPGEVLNGSVSLNMQRAAWWSAGLQFYDSALNQLGTWYSTTYQQHPGGGGWDTSYVYSITAPASTAWAAVVPHISINSTPAATDAIAPIGEIAYCDMHRIWGRPYSLSNTPTPYVAPRKLTITVRANRVNLVNNPGFDTDLFGWGAVGNGSAPFPNSWDGTTGRSKPGALKYSLPANPSTYHPESFAGPGLLFSWGSSNIGGFGWKTNTTYTSSLYVKLGVGCPAVRITTSGYTPTAGVLNTDDALAHHPELIEGDWIRLWATFTTNSQDDGLLGFVAGMDATTLPDAGAAYWIDDVLNEEGDQLLPYFDGGSPGSDYLWAGTAGRSSSHYYRGFRSSAYRLNDIVRTAAPHGTQFTLLYAQPPE